MNDLGLPCGKCLPERSMVIISEVKIGFVEPTWQGMPQYVLC